MTLSPGFRLGPYEILAPLGAGGMGEVYKARDSRLGREVAVKVITGRLGDDPAALTRFEREARAVAALNHPNILSIHDYGREGNVAYAVMELLEGETLQQRLVRGSLPVSKVTDIAGQISKGLTAAHEKGITHRDLKPANVFLTQAGHVKILDFGLARVSQPLPAGGEPISRDSTAEALTRPGAVMGTVGYMAPEQVRGESADARTDLFAFGCLLYEMLAGRRPFERHTGMDTLAAILKEDPPPLPSSAPPALDRLVRQCLEKRQADRFSSAHDVALALQAVSAPSEMAPPQPAPRSGGRNRRLVLAGATVAGLAFLVAASAYVFRARPGDPKEGGTRQPKIVVLPFENLGAPEDAYFAAGMADEITSRLANVRGLGVISRTSAVGYDRKGKNVRQIGSDLGVDYVLEGSIRWERGRGGESRVRITPQLIRVADDTHVWSDRYDRVIADVFAMQSEVAENAVKAMGITLLPREQIPKEAWTSDLAAYDLYLRGQEATTRGDRRQDIEESARMFQAAVDRDSRFALALAGLARSHLRMYWYHFDRSPERLALAKEAAERAVALRPNLAETHTALGEYFYRGLLDFPPALREFAAALAIQPSSSPARAGTAYIMRRQGRWAEAADALSSALDLDPRNASTLDNLGLTYIFTRRYADADRILGQAVALSPKWAHPYTWKAWLQVLWHGDVNAARAILDAGPEAARSMDDGGTLAGIPLWYSLLPHEYPVALKRLEADPPKSVVDGLYSYWPLPLLRGEVERLAGRQDASRREFEAARLELEQKVAQDPGDARVHSALGIVYAGLGRRPEALREANRGCDLMPSTRDAAAALQRSQDLAQVHVMVGQTSEAIAVWEGLLARSGAMTTHLLTLDPRWGPLRSDPGFQALLRKYEVRP